MSRVNGMHHGVSLPDQAHMLLGKTSSYHSLSRSRHKYCINVPLWNWLVPNGNRIQAGYDTRKILTLN